MMNDRYFMTGSSNIIHDAFVECETKSDKIGDCNEAGCGRCVIYSGKR